MPKIEFRGKECSSLAEMPAKVRHDYFKTEAWYDIPDENPEPNEDMMPGNLGNMSDKVRKTYERVRSKLDEKQSNPGQPMIYPK